MRLPLGCGWRGCCTVPGHVGETPTDRELQDFCNLGYAEKCPRLPRERSYDSVRFDARSAGNEAKSRVRIRFVCERGHLPAGNGFLEFDLDRRVWTLQHPESTIQRKAECFIESYLKRIGH